MCNMYSNNKSFEFYNIKYIWGFFRAISYYHLALFLKQLLLLTNTFSIKKVLCAWSLVILRNELVREYSRSIWRYSTS